MATSLELKAALYDNMVALDQLTRHGQALFLELQKAISEEVKLNPTVGVETPKET